MRRRSPALSFFLSFFILLGTARAAEKEKFRVYVREEVTLEWKRREGATGQLRVKHIKKNSTAAQLGYRKGDEILAIGGESAEGKDLAAFLRLSRQGQPFRVRRKNHELELPPLFRAQTILTSQTHELKPGRRAPPVQVKLPDGKQNLLEHAADKVVLLNFWATWCKPCLEEMPLLSRLQERYRPRGLVVYCVSVDDDGGALRKYLEENPLGLYVIETGGFQSHTAQLYRVKSLPLNVLLDGDGYIVQVLIGHSTDQEEILSRSIDALLELDSSSVTVVREK